MENKIVAITGGSGGICGAMARSLLASGYKVAILDIEEVEWIRSFGDDILFINCDVRSENQIGEAVRMIVDTWGHIDILVNGAAVVHYADLISRDMNIEDEIDVNFKGAVNVIRAVLPYMLEGKGGIVHNMGSLLAFSGHKNMGAYVSSKAALAAFTSTLREEMGGTGIVVNMFYLPLTRTALTHDSGMRQGLMADPEKVGLKLAKKIESTAHDVYADFRTRVQANLIRTFPGIASRFIQLVS
ncbi:MAG: SDR family oxidoreductase [Methanomassiliicoccales archaeon]|nr:SDR family oxidoreductase [Methanomassiliicoccales archaeon]NYT15894.1 SDR family oxidoreductase [Methanomassiliicoccales archaeon]